MPPEAPLRNDGETMTPARCVAPRSSRLADSAFARQLAVRRPGGVDIRLRFRPVPAHTPRHNDRLPMPSVREPLPR